MKVLNQVRNQNEGKVGKGMVMRVRCLVGVGTRRCHDSRWAWYSWRGI